MKLKASDANRISTLLLAVIIIYYIATVAGYNQDVKFIEIGRFFVIFGLLVTTGISIIEKFRSEKIER